MRSEVPHLYCVILGAGLVVGGSEDYSTAIFALIVRKDINVLPANISLCFELIVSSAERFVDAVKLFKRRL